MGLLSFLQNTFQSKPKTLYLFIINYTNEKGHSGVFRTYSNSKSKAAKELKNQYPNSTIINTRQSKQ